MLSRCLHDLPQDQFNFTSEDIVTDMIRFLMDPGLGGASARHRLLGEEISVTGPNGCLLPAVHRPVVVMDTSPMMRVAPAVSFVEPRAPMGHRAPSPVPLEAPAEMTVINLSMDADEDVCLQDSELIGSATRKPRKGRPRKLQAIPGRRPRGRPRKVTQITSAGGELLTCKEAVGRLLDSFLRCTSKVVLVCCRVHAIL